jgi:fused signal recognition particle receptor
VTARAWWDGLSRTRQAAFSRIGALFGGSQGYADVWDQLESALIRADVGAELTGRILDDLREEAQRERLDGAQVFDHLRRLLLGKLPTGKDEEAITAPWVVILVGVNGSGKTTAAARLAGRWKRRGKKVLLAAADTYRAAAGEQLLVWGERLGIEVLGGQPGADPGAVVYTALEAARSRGVEVVIADTSGRMHTRHNLMAELEKVVRVAGKACPGAPHQVLLVLDATTGQNGLAQARAFTRAVGVNGVILAKLDTSAKGGVALAVADQLKVPILYAGLGEGPDDLVPFQAEDFVEGLIAGAAPP